MELMVRQVNRITVMAVEGELTTVTAVAFLRQARRAVASDRIPLVAVDLGLLRRIDSSGCAALLSLRRDLQRRRGRLCLFGPAPGVRFLLEVMQAHLIVDISSDLPGALESLTLEAAAAAPAGTPIWNRFVPGGVTAERPIAS
jgi:anti-anti-sigma factor